MIVLLVLVIWFALEVVPLIVGRSFEPINIVRIILWVVLVALLLNSLTGARSWL